jgi:histidyl-tRNA synthetase
VLEKIRKVFETFGFQPLETSALEPWEVLSAKGAGGDEILKESYNFEDKGGRKIGLRYDLTVPLARVISENPNLPLPFKRYQIEKVWRYGDIAKDRFREFLQADIDIVGSDSAIADAEVIACATECFNALGFKKFLIRLNNRKILTEMLKSSEIENGKFSDTLRTIDKLDKIGLEGVKKELEDKGIPSESIKKVMKFIEIKGENEKVLREIESLGEGVKELKEIISYLKAMKLDSRIKVDLSLARGLDYYTGPIFEVLAEEGIGSIAGGGRYDKMIGLFLRDIPATGISLGIERIIEVMTERKMIDKIKNNTKIFVVAVNDKVRGKVLEIVKLLREKSIATDYDLRFRNLSKQLEYVNSSGIPFVAIVGEKELEKKCVKIRNMKTGKEKLVKINEIFSMVEV